MPELPEVETTLRGISPHLIAKKVTAVVIRQRQLRWPITRGLSTKLVGHKIQDISRRGKYLLLQINGGSLNKKTLVNETFDNKTLLIHLGMSGSLRVLPAKTPPEKHDHVDIQLSNKILRYTDPRRFGAILWITGDPLKHKLLSHLGPEPLSDDFSGDYLFETSRKRSVAIKTFIMDGNVVVGVGNIYANEALFLSGIKPDVSAGKISKTRYQALVEHIKLTLQQAIEAGGTTLKDFVSPEGKAGYFQQELKVYGRQNQPCTKCGTKLKQIRQAQRTTVFCPFCQK